MICRWSDPSGRDGIDSFTADPAAFAALAWLDGAVSPLLRAARSGMRAIAHDYLNLFRQRTGMDVSWF